MIGAGSSNKNANIFHFEGHMTQVPFVHPSHLVGINSYIDDAKKCFFSWRWFKRGDNEDFRVITLEEGSSPYFVHSRDAYLRPLEFVGVNGYSDDISNTSFCWRWAKRNDSDFRVLTIEDGGGYHSANPQVYPIHLQGIFGYQDNILPLRFCWRWFNRGDEKFFRYVTLE